MGASQSIEISATPQEVFARYEAVTTWPQWDPEVVAVSLPEGLLPGSQGWIKPRKGPRTRIEVTAVTHGTAFTIESPLPLARLRFCHALEATPAGTRTRHWIEFAGPLGFLYALLLGRGLAAGLPQTLAGLKAACEDTPAPGAATTGA